MVLRNQLEKDPQFQVALELVQNKDMYNQIITPADAKVRRVLKSMFLELLELISRSVIIISYHTIPYHTIPYHIISYHIISYHTVPVSYTHLTLPTKA